MLNFRLMERGETRPYEQNYDLVIIGGGPGGLAAGLYGARAGLKTLLLEKNVPGGQMATTERVENCPGCIEGTGAEIGQWMHRQGTKFGLSTLTAEVTAVDLTGDIKKVTTREGELSARAVIIAAGARPRQLGVPGEQEFWGRGVSVCATCDGPFTVGQTVAVVGGGDSAVKEGDYLTRFADKVLIIHRRDQLRADYPNQQRALANPKIEFVLDSVVEEIVGDDGVKAVKVRNVKTQERTEIPVSAVFLYVGMIPNSDIFRGQVELDEWGYIRTDSRMATSLPGVWAVGDIRSGAVRQIVTAMADGAVAAISAEEYLRENAPVVPLTMPMAEQK